jgi:hypothetical protein
MIRNHIRHLHTAIDSQSLAIRGVITMGALLALPLFGTTVRWLGEILGLGQLVVPLLVVAHVPVVIALIALWSIGCDVCRSRGTA